MKKRFRAAAVSLAFVMMVSILYGCGSGTGGSNAAEQSQSAVSAENKEAENTEAENTEAENTGAENTGAENTEAENVGEAEPAEETSVYKEGDGVVLDNDQICVSVVKYEYGENTTVTLSVKNKTEEDLDAFFQNIGINRVGRFYQSKIDDNINKQVAVAAGEEIEKDLVLSVKDPVDELSVGCSVYNGNKECLSNNAFVTYPTGKTAEDIAVPNPVEEGNMTVLTDTDDYSYSIVEGQSFGELDSFFGVGTEISEENYQFAELFTNKTDKLMQVIVTLASVNGEFTYAVPIADVIWCPPHTIISDYITLSSSLGPDFPGKDAVEEVSLNLTIYTYENGDAEASAKERTDKLTFTVKK